MSGPKVVRIVTPAEYAALQARRDEVLAELESCIVEWTRKLGELGVKTEERERELRIRAAAFKGRFFPNYDKTMSAVLQEMRDIRTEVEKAILEDSLRKKQKRRRLQQSAMSVRDMLSEQNCAVPEELDRVVSKVMTASDLELREFEQLCERILGKIVASAPVRGAQSTSDADKALLGALSAGLAPAESTDGLKKCREVIDARLSKVDEFCAQIEMFGSVEEQQKLRERLERIHAEPSRSRQTLLVDALLIDLSKTSKQLSEQRKVKELWEGAIAKAKELPEAIRQLSIAEIKTAASSTRDYSAAVKLVEQMMTEIDLKNRRHHAAEKRRAVLNALSSLGYSVQEGMVTAWEKDGRLVVAKAATPNVGVELGAAETVERIQMRAVEIAPSTQAPAKLDGKKVEEQWCTELQKLQQLLGVEGGYSHIDAAKAAGEVPLKVCQMRWTNEDTEAEAQESSLRPNQSQMRK